MQHVLSATYGANSQRRREVKCPHCLCSVQSTWPLPDLQAVLVFLHGNCLLPEAYGLQLNRLAAYGVLVLAPCGVEGIRGYSQFSDMKNAHAAYQVRGAPLH